MFEEHINKMKEEKKESVKFSTDCYPKTNLIFKMCLEIFYYLRENLYSAL